MTNSVRRTSHIHAEAKTKCTGQYVQWAGLPYPTQPGQVGGHEGVGKVVKLGPGAEQSSVKVGDRVGIKWISAICGSCGMLSEYRNRWADGWRTRHIG